MDHPNDKIDLRGIDLSGHKLDGAFLMDVNLKSADLSGGSFMGCLFCHSDMSCVNLSNANIEGAHFGPPEFVSYEFLSTELGKWLVHGTKLVKANLRGTNINHTNFRECDLSNADFSGCKNSSTVILKNSILEGTIKPEPWYISYLKSLDKGQLELQMTNVLKGKLFSEEDLKLLQEYVLKMKLLERKEMEQFESEVVALVQKLVDTSLASERYSNIFRIHCLLVSSKGEENIQQFIQCNGHAVVGLMTFDSTSNVRVAANSLITVLPQHHSTAGREFGLRTLAESGLIKIQIPNTN